MTWQEALNELIAGNKRFKGSMKDTSVVRTPERRMEVADGQSPFAVILACADSRVSPEIVFDQWIGDLFVVRVAGNIVNPANYGVLGSIEYAVKILSVNLVMVLGHSRCGAVEGAIQSVQSGTVFSGSIEEIIDTIKPAVINVLNEPGNLLQNSVRENVKLGVTMLNTISPIITPLVEQETVKVVGGKYDLFTGEVTLF